MGLITVNRAANFSKNYNYKEFPFKIPPEIECDKKFSDYAIYEHCLPFNVSRAFDEAKGIDHPRIWTAERDKEMWDLLQ